MYVSNTNKITKHHEQGGRDLIGGVYVSFVVIGDEYKTFQELHVMYRIYHPILKF